MADSYKPVETEKPENDQLEIEDGKLPQTVSWKVVDDKIPFADILKHH